mgnify:CR=1 FL=1
MCGILGFSGDYSKSSKTGSSTKEQFSNCFSDALATLNHRGPDACGVEMLWDHKSFMGHTRLAIQDLSSAGSQPMISQNDNLIITFNGEIYNFPSLKKDLMDLGHSFVSNTDTEVILCLYAEYGTACFKMLDGIFALAIFDKQEEKFILARDEFGIKPLYYYQDTSRFVFSSELKAIVKLVSNNDLNLDAKNIDRYLTFQWCPGEGTPFKEIKKHNPGEVLIIKNSQIVYKKLFYELPITRPQNKKTNTKLEDVVSNLDANLRKAVHDQMLSDAPVGAFLSGGLDSTSVVAFAKEIDPNITCFTIDAQNSLDGLQDDLPYARAAAKFLDVPLEVVSPDAQSLIKNLDKMVWMLDEPLGDTAPLSVLFISELAKESGIKVLLSGAGGDDIFTGYTRHRAVMFDKKLQILPKSILSNLEWLTGKLDKRVTTFRRLAKLFSGSSLTGDQRIINYFKWINRNELIHLYSDKFKAEIVEELAEQPMLNFLQNAHADSSDLDKALALEQRFFLADHNLCYTDKMSMAAGVEVRVPLLSRNLVEFASTIPDKMKQKGAVGKWIFKKTMEPYLPRSIIYRKKTGFGSPLRHWLKLELREYSEDLLSYDSVSERGLFNPHSVGQLMKKNQIGQIDASFTILSLMCIEIWCRQHLDGLPYADPLLARGT